MNELILPVVVGVSTGFVAGVLACVVYAFSKSAKKPPRKVKPENLPPIYTDEEIELTRFLEEKQAINEAFLYAQAELLKELHKF